MLSRGNCKTGTARALLLVVRCLVPQDVAAGHARAGRWPVARGRSFLAGSRPRGLRGTPSATPMPTVARSSGSLTTHSSTTTRPRVSSTSTPSPASGSTAVSQRASARVCPPALLRVCWSCGGQAAPRPWAASFAPCDGGHRQCSCTGVCGEMRDRDPALPVWAWSAGVGAGAAAVISLRVLTARLPSTCLATSDILARDTAPGCALAARKAGMSCAHQNRPDTSAGARAGGRPQRSGGRCGQPGQPGNQVGRRGGQSR